MTTVNDRSTLRRLTGTELSRGYAAGDFTPSDVAEAVLETIDARNPELNAFTDYHPEAVRESAKESTQRWQRGEPLSPYDGVTWTIKENLKRRGVSYRSGTAASDPLTPDADSPVVARARESGAVIVGSTTMPDYGMLSSGVSSLHGISRSPWDPGLTTGGSSAGAGAAAAAGFAATNIGTDIGGSIRLPGTWLGLATLKPSDGRVPLDTPTLGRAAGPMARTVEDLAWTMEIISKPDARDWASLPPAEIDWAALDLDPAGLKIGLHLDAGAGMPLEPEIRDAVVAAAQVFADAGAEVTEVAPFIDDDVLIAVDQFWRVRSWEIFQKLTIEQQAKVLPFIVQWTLGGADVSGARVFECYNTIERLRAATIAATLPYDVVLSPVAPVAAFPAEWPMPFGFENRGMAHIGFTLPYNMSGQPAATVNCGFMPDGRPIGVQIAGPRFDDRGVLRAAAWYEAHRPETAVPQFPVQ